jgi:MFS family permease
VYLADGAELLLITAVTSSVADDWKLGHFERGMAVTIVFVGVLIGNIICGPLGDRHGRRQLIITSYVGIFIFSVLSSLSPGYNMFCISRHLDGLRFGIGQPAWNALCTEVTPRYWRIAMNGLSQTLFVAGEIYSASLIIADDPDLKNLHWRRLLQFGAIPSALFAFAAVIFLLPSPSFLALHGQTEAARGVLEIMKADNLQDASVSTDFQVDPPTSRMSAREFGYQFKEIFSAYYRSSTCITALTCFGLNTVYYGCLYAFPQLLKSSSVNGSAGLQLLIGALCEIPGNAVAIFFGMCMPRKPVMKLYHILMACCLFLFVYGYNAKPTPFYQAVYHLGYYGIKGVACIGYVVVYQYAGEIYPTETRATGTSFCIGSGRLGAMIAPLVFEGFQNLTGSHMPFFYLVAIGCVLNTMLIDLLPFETSEMIMKERLMADTNDSSDLAYGAVESGAVESEASRLAKAFESKPAKEEPVEIDPNLDDGCTMGA